MVRKNPEDYDDWKQRLNGANVRKPLVETAVQITNDDESYQTTFTSMLDDLDEITDTLKDRVDYTGDPDVIRAQLSRFVSEPLARRYEQNNPPESLTGLIDSVHQVIQTAPSLEDPDWTDLDEPTTRALTLSRATTRLGPVIGPHADHSANQTLLLNGFDRGEVLSVICDDIHGRAVRCTDAMTQTNDENVVTTVYQSIANNLSDSYEQILNQEARSMIREFKHFDETQRDQYMNQLNENEYWIPLVQRTKKTIDTIQGDMVDSIVPGSTRPKDRMKPEDNQDLGGHFNQDDVSPSNSTDESMNPGGPF